VRPPRFHLLLPLLCLLATAARAAEPEATRLTIQVRDTTCSALLLRPADSRALLVLAHGQVMNIHSPFMESISVALARHGVATLRFNFPYAEAKRQQPDPPRLLVDTVIAAAREGEKRRGALPLFVGGKSAGGMMTAYAAKNGELPAYRGIVLLTYPLHAPGRPSAMNAQFVEGISQPLLFVQGSLDPLGEITLLDGLVEKLGENARLAVVRDADHSFALPEGSVRTEDQVYDEVASAVAGFVATLARAGGK